MSTCAFMNIDRYDASSGIFTCDTPGMYFFEQYWVSTLNLGQRLFLKKNGETVCTSAGVNNGYYSASCAALLELIPGDKVWIVSSLQRNVYKPEASGFIGFMVKSYV